MGKATTTALTVDARVFKAITASAVLFAGTDDLLPVLTAVRVRGDGRNRVVFEATDRYRAVEIGYTLQAPNTRKDAGLERVTPKLDVLLPAKALHDTVKAWKVPNRYRRADEYLIRLTITPAADPIQPGAARVEFVTYGQTTATTILPTVPGAFPKLEKILAGAPAAPADVAYPGRVQFDAGYLADMAKAAAPVSLSRRPAVQLNAATSPVRPWLFTLPDGNALDGVSWRALLMPQRVEGWTEEWESRQNRYAELAAAQPAEKVA